MNNRLIDENMVVVIIIAHKTETLSNAEIAS
jgi:hypothetical protein